MTSHSTFPEPDRPAISPGALNLNHGVPESCAFTIEQIENGYAVTAAGYPGRVWGFLTVNEAIRFGRWLLRCQKEGRAA